MSDYECDTLGEALRTVDENKGNKTKIVIFKNKKTKKWVVRIG